MLLTYDLFATCPRGKHLTQTLEVHNGVTHLRDTPEVHTHRCFDVQNSLRIGRDLTTENHSIRNILK